MLTADCSKKNTGHPAAHALARYRCFLPDLAGLAGLRRAGPGTVILASSADALENRQTALVAQFRKNLPRRHGDTEGIGSWGYRTIRTIGLAVTTGR